MMKNETKTLQSGYDDCVMIFKGIVIPIQSYLA